MRTDAVADGGLDEYNNDYDWAAIRAFRRRRALKYANTITPPASAIHVIITFSFPVRSPGFKTTRPSSRRLNRPFPDSHISASRLEGRPPIGNRGAISSQSPR